MKKHQPEGNYLSHDSSKYDSILSALALVRIDLESISAKFKFGQNLGRERYERLIEQLELEGATADLRLIRSVRDQFQG